MERRWTRRKTDFGVTVGECAQVWPEGVVVVKVMESRVPGHLYGEHKGFAEDEAPSCPG